MMAVSESAQSVRAHVNLIRGRACCCCCCCSGFCCWFSVPPGCAPDRTLRVINGECSNFSNNCVARANAAAVASSCLSMLLGANGLAVGADERAGVVVAADVDGLAVGADERAGVVVAADVDGLAVDADERAGVRVAVRAEVMVVVRRAGVIVVVRLASAVAGRVVVVVVALGVRGGCEALAVLDLLIGLVVIGLLVVLVPNRSCCFRSLA
jgi:hypothetical protein